MDFFRLLRSFPVLRSRSMAQSHPATGDDYARADASISATISPFLCALGETPAAA
jgi:hypothetical protein